MSATGKSCCPLTAPERRFSCQLLTESFARLGEAQRVESALPFDEVGLGHDTQVVDCSRLGNRAVTVSRVDRYRQGPTPANRSGVIRMMKPGGGSSMGGNFTSGSR